MTNCILVDDEPLALRLLESYVSNVDGLELLASFSDPIAALNYCNLHTVDVIFLDIQMPQLTGIQLSKLIQGPKIIFVTAYPDFAVEGFEIAALDYIVKPVSFDRFLKAAQRAMDAANPAVTQDAIDYIFVKSEHKSIRVDLDDILYLKGMGDYVDIQLTSGRIMTLENLKHFEQTLPPQKFLRVHKSYIISLSKIDFIEKGKVVINDTVINVGPTYLESFRKVLGG